MIFGDLNEVFVANHHDAIMVAFHREAASNLLPYNSFYDSSSWWYSQVTLI